MKPLTVLFNRALLASLLVLMSLLATTAMAAPFFTNGGGRCETLFSDTKNWRPDPLEMKSKYKGEENGSYLDPITNEPWHVRYFNRRERQAFEIFEQNGIFVNRKGKRLDSEFDAESLHFHEGLFVVDRDMRMYFYPRDVRGQIHHSSLVGGEPVLFAGMAAFMGGELRLLNDSSGHYQAQPERTKWFVRELHRRGFNLNRLVLTGRVAPYYGRGSAALDAKEIERYLLNP